LAAGEGDEAPIRVASQALAGALDPRHHAAAMGSPGNAVDLSDPRLFDRGAPHAVFGRLRRESPVYWNEEPDGSGFWAITRYADVHAVSSDAETFSSERRGVMIFDQSYETSGRARMMIEMDPPHHTRLRALISRGMTPRAIQELEAFARDAFAKTLEGALAKGRCDFVDDVAGQLPLQIIAEMVGVPEADRPRMGELAHRIQGFEDPEVEGSEGVGENAAAIGEMAEYALELARERRREPRDDIATAILQADLDGESMDDDSFASFFLLLITAGIETTKAAITGGMLAFTQHPDQWTHLREDPGALSLAIEEVIRWTTPIHHMRRTATRAAEIGGQPIREDDKVVVWYSSANRDEAVFEDPDRFDIAREPNEHLSFGFGRHFCLGANLARLEMRVVYEALLDRAVEIECAGEAEYLRSTFTNALKRMPVEMRALSDSGHIGA
jgi:cholest-4-en-3-one 26-monooxygenase